MVSYSHDGMPSGNPEVLGIFRDLCRVIASSISSNNNKVLPWSMAQGPIMRSPSSHASTSMLGIKIRSLWLSRETRAVTFLWTGW